MYTTAFRGICDVRFDEVEANGTRIRLDRRALLKLSMHPYKATPSTQIYSPDEAMAQARKLCAIHPADIRMNVRCSQVAGWRVVATDLPVCRR